MAKLNTKSLILTIVSVVLGILSFVGMAFKFMVVKAYGESERYSFSKSMDTLDDLKKMKADGVGTINAGKVFLIIALVLMVIALVLLVVDLFVQNKWLNLATAIIGTVAIVCFVLFFILTFVGMNQVSDWCKDTVRPSVAVYFIALCGIASSAFATLKYKTK